MWRWRPRSASASASAGSGHRRHQHHRAAQRGRTRWWPRRSSYERCHAHGHADAERAAGASTAVHRDGARRGDRSARQGRGRQRAGGRTTPGRSRPRTVSVTTCHHLAEHRDAGHGLRLRTPRAVELGVKFRSDVSGSVTGHALLQGPDQHRHACRPPVEHHRHSCSAKCTFTNETASGWQQVLFATPIAIDANTTYVVSYFAPNGGYSITSNYLHSSGDRQRRAARAQRRGRRRQRRLRLRRPPAASRTTRSVPPTTGSTWCSRTSPVRTPRRPTITLAHAGERRGQRRGRQQRDGDLQRGDGCHHHQ